MEAYDAMAPIYDEFNKANDYEVWLGEVLLPELERHGLRGKGWALDVGCGTGRAFEPLLRRGFSVHGKDVSRQMVEIAAEKIREFAGQLYEGDMRVGVADARDLPELREDGFDLILALNDVVNYLIEDGDLELFFGGVKRNLAEGGLVCFDANTLAILQGSWTTQGGASPPSHVPLDRRGWEWKGLTVEGQPGGIFEAEVAGEGIGTPSIHRERHWLRGDIEAAMEASGIRCLAALGMREEGETVFLEEPPGGAHHLKTIYVASHRE